MGTPEGAPLPGNEGSVLRINEAYEHEPMLPGQGDEGRLPNNGCKKIVTQCVAVTAPVVLTPTASVGTVTVSCQGAPSINCTADPCGTSATLTLTQQVCVTVPVCYGVGMDSGEATISCTDCGTCHSAPCGCKG